MREAFDKVCGHIPSRFSSQCTDYVDQYGEMIMDLLAQELSPEMVRILLKFFARILIRKKILTNWTSDCINKDMNIR